MHPDPEPSGGAMRPGGLFAKLALSMALLVTVSVGLMTLVAVGLTRQGIRDRALSANLTAATLAARAVDRYVADSVSILTEAAERPKLGQELRAEHWAEADQSLANVLRHFKQLDHVLVMDAAGVVRSRVPAGTPRPGETPSFEVFREVVATGQVRVTGARAPEPGARPAVTILAPTQGGGALVGALSLDALGQFLAGIGQDDGHRISIVDAQGKVLADSHHGAASSDSEETLGPIVGAAVRGAAGTMEFKSARGAEALLGAHVPVGRLGWGVVVVRPRAVAEAPALRLERWLVAVAAVCAAAAIALSWALARALTRPIMRLAAATQELARGNLRVRVHPRGVDEVATLGHAFDAMADEMQRSYEALRLARDGLEQRVQERTLAVSAANERLELEVAERRRAEREADRANQAKSEFLSRMSHELRTPLNGILGFAQILDLEQLSASDRESVEQILRAGRHLLRLINEVLDISRIEAGRLDLSLEPVPVGEALRSVVNLVAPLAAGRVHIRLEPPPEGVHVWADRQRLEQVLLNLLSNAVKYNRPGGRVILACTPKAGSRLRIGVTDTGPGLSREQVERLFMPFERLGAERTEVEGTGLGLALSRRLTDAMGGVLEVDSQLGVGSTFAVTFPASAGGPSTALSEGARPRAARPAGISDRHLLVLYVEDNPSNLQLVERIIARRPGAALISSAEGRRGFELARERRPDLILLDRHLPDLPGDEVLRLLRADAGTRSIPVVILSADANPRHIQRLRDAGIVAYITKPIDIGRLLEIIDDVARSPSTSSIASM